MSCLTRPIYPQTGTNKADQGVIREISEANFPRANLAQVACSKPPVPISSEFAGNDDQLSASLNCAEKNDQKGERKRHILYVFISAGNLFKFCCRASTEYQVAVSD